jgi:hypothetical protein
VPPSGDEDLAEGAPNPAPECTKGGTRVHSTRHPSSGIEDHQEHQEIKPTGADAPGDFLRPETEEPEITDPTPATYAELARLAIADANAARDDSVPSVTVHFRRRCAARNLPHDDAVALDAITEALADRDQARVRFLGDLARAAGRSFPRATVEAEPHAVVALPNRQHSK